LKKNIKTVCWNKEIKKTAKKIEFQTSTSAKYETPKKKCKTYAKPKTPKKEMEKKWNQGHGECQGPYLPGPGPARGSFSQRP
jgi:hypothetical protein